MASDPISRRGFVESVGLAAGAATLIGPGGASRAVGANDKIRLALIGGPAGRLTAASVQASLDGERRPA